MPSDDMEGAGFVFGQGLWPIGWNVGFVERDLEDVMDAVGRWGDAAGEAALHSDESLGRLLARLPPLEWPDRRRLLVGTQSGWTAYFDNSTVGGWPSTWVSTLAKNLGCRCVTATHIPPAQHQYPATSFEIVSPDGGQLRRVGGGVHTDGEWHFDATGEVQPFERPEMYDAPLPRDRLTRQALLEYLLAMGIRADDPDWYRGGVIYERPAPRREQHRPRRLSIQAARRGHPQADRRVLRSGDRSYLTGCADPADELARLRLVEQECDPTTIRHLTRLGIGRGWRCLVVGSAGGSVVRWLANEVGPTGTVAADMDPQVLGDIDLPNVEVRRLEGMEHSPIGHFDLVHSRLLLMHAEDPPSHVFSRMFSAVRDDGGWLVMEEPDYGTIEATEDSHKLSGPFNDAIRKWVRAVTDSGIADLRIGGSLPALVAERSILDFGNEATTREVRGGRPLSLMWSRTWERANDALLADGAITEADLAVLRQAYEDPDFYYREQLMQAVWVRRPERG